MKSTALSHQLLAEFLGVFVLILFGTGVVAMVTLFGTGAPAEVTKGGFTNVTLAWGLGVLFGVCLAGKISGAHLNPAITIALAAFRGFPWRKVLPYAAAQSLGAFCAAAVVYWNYLPAFDAFDPQREKTAFIFATFPAFPQAPWAGFLDQVVGTALLMGLVLVLTDRRNIETSPVGAAALIALVVVAIGMSFGGMHGYAINPARDFGPRLFTVLAGFPHNVLTDGTFVFVTPIVGPIVGALAAALVYDRTLGAALSHFTAKETPAP